MHSLPAAAARPRTVATRLHWATVTAVAAVAALLSVLYAVESGRIQDAREAQLHAVVDSATAIAAAQEKEEREGRMTRAEAQAAAARAIGTIRYLGAEYVWINDMHPKMVMHPIKPELNGQDLSTYKDPNGKRLFVAFADTVRANGAGVVDYLWPRPGSDAPVPKLSYVRGFQPWGWVLGTGVYVDDLATARRHLAWSLAALGTATSLIVGATIWLLGRGISRPLRALTKVTEQLSNGDLTVATTGVDRNDEFGALARALEVLKGNSLERLRLEGAAAGERAARDRRQTDMDQMTQDFGAVISGVLGRLTHAAGDMSETARAMADGTARTRDSVTRTAEGSAASSRDLSTVAAATVELSASVDEIARQIGHATGATREAVSRAAETGATFLRLAEMAEKIGDVGGAISAIAAQTNLLALNATIEAARAGDAGKGFAVVANEVKALAAQTARATAEIGEHAAAIRAATEHTAAAIKEVGQAVERVDAVSAAIAAAVEEQGATTREIAQNVQSVSGTSDLTATAMEDVAAIAARTGDLSQTVLTASGDIGDVAASLREEVDQFLRAMARDDRHRRLYERVAGSRTPVTLSFPGGRRANATLRDISGGGVALHTEASGEVGEEVTILFTGSRIPAHGRVVRHGLGVLAIAFRQDDATMAEVERAIAALGGTDVQRLAA